MAKTAFHANCVICTTFLMPLFENALVFGFLRMLLGLRGSWVLVSGSPERRL